MSRCFSEHTNDFQESRRVSLDPRPLCLDCRFSPIENALKCVWRPPAPHAPWSLRAHFNRPIVIVSRQCRRCQQECEPLYFRSCMHADTNVKGRGAVELCEPLHVSQMKQSRSEYREHARTEQSANTACHTGRRADTPRCPNSPFLCDYHGGGEGSAAPEPVRSTPPTCTHRL